MKTSSGYSGTPLERKLGIREGIKIRLIGQPKGYLEFFERLPGNLLFTEAPGSGFEMIHFFTQKADEIARFLPKLKAEIKQNGFIWVSWPKKSSKIPTDVTEDVIRALALENGLVDIKVCAVDNTWSALKLVVPLKERIP